MARTVKVRIAVAVGEGRWAVGGSSETQEWSANRLAIEWNLYDGSGLALPGEMRELGWTAFTHEIEIPVPEPVEVEGVVEEADDA